MKTVIITWSVLAATVTCLGVLYCNYNLFFQTLNIYLEAKIADTTVSDLKENTTLILFWTSFFGTPDFGFGIGHTPFKAAGCKIHHCEMTTNKSRLKEASAVIFHIRDVNNILPTKRFAHQRYIFFLLESPKNTHLNLNDFKNFFNWTMTYRLDSDIVIRYGYVLKTIKPQLSWQKRQHELVKIVKGKSKLVAWFASNCHTSSKREMLVKELQKYINIDIYGSCGNLVCKEKAQCFDMLEKDYKFYLSFENSVCNDYHTEKLYTVLNKTVVPIVYGGENYSVDAPPHSFIDVQDFDSARHQAKYLIKLNADYAAYMKYFDWKEQYHVQVRHTHHNGFCKLCELLHDSSRKEQVIAFISKWWSEGQCNDTLPFRLWK